ncbi:STAS-like domain-containing protein [Algoriphagus persicinus]|uniref:STAS-like domain-containing protein n=1 Tax=Algoriphagus persicinus TaxID=3108754 RepID=UPI002B3AF0DE|nr:MULTISPECIES: STAS-like domain-containing protein [unclassified Algoriphagus]MEB2781583.1 STAS-like domain-containing protein [Algoriphagus sp. C2-6-M1]MEB2783780.1 STAS-like domain-containing protein [Algoriphagus sp. E1-3-M2]
MKILLTDIVSDTYSNAAGYSLYLVLKNKLKDGEVIQLSFLGASPPSTSFLNSSFGSLIDEMGLDDFLSLVKPAEVTHTQASMLKHYIQGFRSGAKA